MFKEFNITTGGYITVNALHVCSVKSVQYTKSSPKFTEIVMVNGSYIHVSDDYDYVCESLGVV